MGHQSSSDSVSLKASPRPFHPILYHALIAARFLHIL